MKKVSVKKLSAKELLKVSENYKNEYDKNDFIPDDATEKEIEQIEDKLYEINDKYVECLIEIERRQKLGLM